MPRKIDDTTERLIQREFELGYTNDQVAAGPYEVSFRIV